jgi:predicted esterase/ribosomal protein L17
MSTLRAMRYCALLFSLVLLYSFPAQAVEKVVKQSIVSRGKTRTFYLFVPDNLSPARPVPLLVLLHGSGHNGLSLVEKWKDLASKEGIILAGPDAANPNVWSPAEDGPDFLRDLVENLKSKYPINPHRVYLFGHSGGAVYALTVSMLESEYFAATAVHAGAWRQDKEYQLIDLAHRKIPIAIWIGTNDQFFSLKAVRATRDALQAKGFSIQVTEMPGHDHWYYDLAPKINQSAWEFLAKHELSAEQRYAEYGDEGDTSRANNLIQEIDTLRKKAYELRKQAERTDTEVQPKDFLRDRREIRLMAQQELELLNQSAALWLEAADKADSVERLKLDDKNKQYLLLISQHNRKNAEIVRALRGQAEALLNDDSAETITTKRNEVRKLVERLQQEADELQKQMERLMK